MIVPSTYPWGWMQDEVRGETLARDYSLKLDQKVSPRTIHVVQLPRKKKNRFQDNQKFLLLKIK